MKHLAVSSPTGGHAVSIPAKPSLTSLAKSYLKACFEFWRFVKCRKCISEVPLHWLHPFTSPSFILYSLPPFPRCSGTWPFNPSRAPNPCSWWFPAISSISVLLIPDYLSLSGKPHHCETLAPSLSCEAGQSIVHPCITFRLQQGVKGAPCFFFPLLTEAACFRWVLQCLLTLSQVMQ